MFSPKTSKLGGQLDSSGPTRQYRLHSSLHSDVYTLLYCKFNFKYEISFEQF